MNEMQSGYRLDLCDGMSWGFQAAPELQAWLDDLAQIMRLRNGTNGAQHPIVFVPKRLNGAAQVPESLGGHHVGTASGWHSFQVGEVLRAWWHDERQQTVVELNEAYIGHPEIKYIDMWSALRAIHRHAIRHGGGPVHAALAEREGKAILIAAAGDTGKSTCCRRLPGPWRGLCDDQALIVCRPAGGYGVHPLPTWSDYLWRTSANTWDCGHAARLCAVFFLRQASEDAVEPLPPSEGAVELFCSAKEVLASYWSRLEDQEKRRQSERLFHNALEMAKHVPAFTLHATRHGQFWEAVERVL